MYIVTGAAGFIGSNIIKSLNDQGIHNIVAVDDLSNGHKFTNLVDLKIIDYIDKEEFINDISNGVFDDVDITAVLHQGACSDTTEWDGRYMMENNYEYAKTLLQFCINGGIPFVYASSAAVYGASTNFAIDPANEGPLNVYGYSKLLFDQYVRRILKQGDHSQIVGLRYFNVYGPHEQHKGKMASVAFHQKNQMEADGKVKLFGAYDGYAAGEQKRDFVYVGDVADVNLWFLDNPTISGIFNCGTGRSQPFNDIANAVINWYGRGEIEYIDFPESLKGHYQSFTQADISGLREAGYDKPFKTVEEGINAYFNYLAEKHANTH